ncbi:hypothetical protein sS8_3607 [Methylocaldum marinum]|uniref:Uncharacterized protein n=1 Tax=Methylocaldum marinum TaxID=1432792 RepID=A0A250KVL3_9GAMM|nr:hypothetical protein sS8_3607 [Methylocaldum marinum]
MQLNQPFAIGDASEDQYERCGSFVTASYAGWLRNVRLDSLKKHGRGPKKPLQKNPDDPKQPHVSTYKLLRDQ